ncbi:MAG: hypothetical protein KF691_12320 [Phycisphaeraceae bacterium]|nr:hypothetical protein [Phycisphaeraceae bacterium]
MPVLWNQIQIPTATYPRGFVVSYAGSGVLSLWLLFFGAPGAARIFIKRNRAEVMGEVEKLTFRLLIYVVLASALSVFWIVARFTGLFG